MPWGAIAAGLIGAAGSIAGSRRASNAMENAADQNAAVQERIFNQQRQDLAPYRAVGNSALNAYARAMGLPQYDQNTDPGSWGGGGDYSSPLVQVVDGVPRPNMARYNSDERYRNAWDGLLAQHRQQFGVDYNRYSDVTNIERALTHMGIGGPTQGQPGQPSGQAPGQTTEEDRYGGFYESPGYQFRFDEGARAVDRNMASRGLLNSGARGRAMTRYGQGIASDEFGNYMNRLAGAAGIGQTAVNSGNALAGTYGANVGNAMMNSGMARASGYLGMGSAISSGANNFLAALPYFQRQRGIQAPTINPSVTVG